MQWVIAYVQGTTIYAMHDKIYFKKTQASNALKTMLKSGKLQEGYKVWRNDVWNLKKESDT